MPVRLGPVELLIILAIVVVLFGAGRIANIGSELGSAIRNFREGMRSDDGDEENEQEPEAEKTKTQG
jgi:sec-independent protein translocase protein TatA